MRGTLERLNRPRVPLTRKTSSERVLVREVPAVSIETARCLYNLANAYFGVGRVEEAIETHRQALALRRKIGHRPGEGASLRALAKALEHVGDREGARRSLADALVVLEELGSADTAKVRAELLNL